MAQFVRNKQVQEEFRDALDFINRDWSLNLERQLLDVREIISKQMEKKNMSRADLAKALDSSRSYVTQLLDGNQNLRLGTLFKISFALGLRPTLGFVDEEIALVETFSLSRIHHKQLKPIEKSETITFENRILKEKYELTT